jgi:hypothetical protein
LYGAYEVLGQRFQNIEALIDHIISFETDKCPMLGLCTAIHHQVLAVYPKADLNKRTDVGMISSNAAKNRLYTEPGSSLGKAREAILSKLNFLYADPINKKTYSWNSSKRNGCP